MLDADFPMGPFREASVDVVKLARRVKKMNETLYGRCNVGKILHLQRRLGAEFLALAGYVTRRVPQCHVHNPWPPIL